MAKQETPTEAIRTAILKILSDENETPCATADLVRGLAPVPAHRVRYALEQMEVSGAIVRVGGGSRARWDLAEAKTATVPIPVAEPTPSTEEAPPLAEPLPTESEEPAKVITEKTEDDLMEEAELWLQTNGATYSGPSNSARACAIALDHEEWIEDRHHWVWTIAQSCWGRALTASVPSATQQPETTPLALQETTEVAGSSQASVDLGGAFCTDQSHNRDADGFCIRCGKSAEEASTIAVEPEPPVAEATPGVAVAKRRAKKASVEKTEKTPKEKKEKTEKTEKTPKEKKEKTPKEETDEPSQELVAETTRSLAENGVRGKLTTVLADGRQRPVAEVARVLGLASRLQRLAFERLIADFVKDGLLMANGKEISLAPTGALVNTAGLLAGIASALGVGASPGSITVSVGGPALLVLANLLGLDACDGSKLTRTPENRTTGFWPILSRNGTVLDDATKAPIGSWQTAEGKFAAALRDGRSFTAASRRDLQAAIVESVSATPLPSV